MAYTLIGGTAVGTVLILVFLPALYAIWFRVRESSILSEVDDTSILRTGLPSPLWPSSQLATGLSSLAPRSGLERSDFVHWH
jgi:hypothetical protein